MQWYYSQGGVQRGPVTQEQLVAMVADGRLGAHELVWREGMSQWQVFTQVDELRASGVAGAPPLPTTHPLNPYSAPFNPGSPYLPPGTVPTYLWQAIVVTLFCCMPFGIAAIVFASKVDGLLARGDLAGAQNASKSARTWCWVSLGLGLLFMLFGVASTMFAPHAG